MDERIINTAYARESDIKKGMDQSQITGTASSYARKYALNGLFNIDDTKDADTDEYTKKTKEADKKEVGLMPIQTGQIQIIKQLLEDSEFTMAQILKKYKAHKIEDLSYDEGTKIRDGLSK